MPTEPKTKRFQFEADRLLDLFEQFVKNHMEDDGDTSETSQRMNVLNNLLKVRHAVNGVEDTDLIPEVPMTPSEVWDEIARIEGGEELSTTDDFARDVASRSAEAAIEMGTRDTIAFLMHALNVSPHEILEQVREGVEENSGMDD